MLFNSFPFLLFLPVTLAGYYVIFRRCGLVFAVGWLFAASLVFYSGWGLQSFIVLLVSMTLNFAMGRAIARGRSPGIMLTFALVFNLLLLGYYKYAGFFSENLGAMAHVHFATDSIRLPVGISFFTFTQIAYLVDVYRRQSFEPDYLYYGLFVSYFPHLVAGPILHHAEMIPQFRRQPGFDLTNVTAGLGIFLMGLAKKLLLADSVAPYVNAVFDGTGDETMLAAWGGALCYCMQIYFDFSGYCDMAVGISKMFGILLPINFNSPYKSASIIEFWRRWHITLSRFLRDYLYIPLGGNRKGQVRRYANLLCTMILGGIWHGAGWTFMFWGFLHGMYLAVNHLWRSLFDASRLGSVSTGVYRYAATLLTFLCVTIAWVFFRAPSFARAWKIIRDMAGQGENHLVAFEQIIAPARFLLLFVIAMFLPNTQQLFARFNPALGMELVERQRWSVRLNAFWGFVFGVLAFVLWQEMVRTDASPFLYFRF